MQNQQQSLQGQTAQPAPTVQDPQATEESNLQPTLNQQNLDTGQSTISIPGSGTNTQTTSTTASPSAATTPNTPLFDVGTPLLIATFVSALVLIGLLAKFAKPKHELDQNVSADPVEVTSADKTPMPQSKQPPKQKSKKTTRRQRKRSKQKSRS